MALTGDGSNAVVYQNGVQVGGGTYTPPTHQYSSGRQLVFGAVNGTGAAEQVRPALGLVWNRPLTPAEVALVSANPWQLFKAPEEDNDLVAAVATTRLYTQDLSGAPYTNPGAPTSSKSSALPVGLGPAAPSHLDTTGALTATAPTSTTVEGDTLGTAASTSLQSGFLFLQTSAPLAAQTISAGNWNWQILCSESSGTANAQLALSVYVWRPSTSAVVGYVYDSATPLGSEWPTTFGTVAGALTGAAVTCAAGDRLVIEWYAVCSQDTAAGTTLSLFGGLDGSGRGTWIEATQTLAFLGPVNAAATLNTGAASIAASAAETVAATLARTLAPASAAAGTAVLVTASAAPATAPSVVAAAAALAVAGSGAPALTAASTASTGALPVGADAAMTGAAAGIASTGALLASAALGGTVGGLAMAAAGTVVDQRFAVLDLVLGGSLAANASVIVSAALARGIGPAAIAGDAGVTISAALAGGLMPAAITGDASLMVGTALAAALGAAGVSASLRVETVFIPPALMRTSGALYTMARPGIDRTMKRKPT
jgi:hypothetical protein